MGMIRGLYLPPRAYGRWLRFFRRYFTLVRTVHVFTFIRLYFSLGLALAYWHEILSHFREGFTGSIPVQRNKPERLVNK